ncbi:hypothetical protein ACJIZ3_012263 [Penstemon smallii]|uniref:Uncharacterized protein n=1 Tax=Penstemon smallii TaxID=265156 RepID=A0ABD3UNN2_9LAMI
MSGGEGRKLSNQDIQLVQNCIEGCLKQYMNKKEVMNDLFIKDNIEPRFTELVWQRLEEENQEFFKAYYLKLLVKDQILEFNRLLSEQVQLMHQTGLIASVLTTNGSHVSPIENMQQQQHPNVFNNCGSSIQPRFQATINDGSDHVRIIDVSPSMYISQNPNVGFPSQTMNGKFVKTEGDAYAAAGTSHFHFNQPPRRNFLESTPLMGDAPVSSFSSVDSNVQQHLNDTLLDADTSSFAFFPQISQNFDLPELPTDFPCSSDMLESYCRHPFLATDANNYGDIERLDPAYGNQCFRGN